LFTLSGFSSFSARSGFTCLSTCSGFSGLLCTSGFFVAFYFFRSVLLPGMLRVRFPTIACFFLNPGGIARILDGISPGFHGRPTGFFVIALSAEFDMLDHHQGDLLPFHGNT